MSEVHIVDTGAMCALGPSVEKVWPRLCRGETAIDIVRDFDTDKLNVHRAARIPDLKTDGEPNRVCALIRGALQQLRPIPRDTFVIWAGVKGDAEYVEALAAGTPTPQVFLPRHYRQWVCRTLGIADRGMEINAACASSSAALALGAAMIAEGSCSSVLVCAADTVSRFTFTGFAALKALSPTTCRPFDSNRDGLCLGEGAATVLLANSSTAAEYKYTPMARLTGWGITNDAHHITGPAPDGRGLTAAIRAALKGANLAADGIEAWCMHGTGTVYNDAMELAAMKNVFGGRRFPIFSPKGSIGHTLGAAGALEVALCVKALSENTVPATASLKTPEPSACGCVANEPQPFSGSTVLTSNSGFGGVNVALILESNDAEPRTKVAENGGGEA